MQFNHLRDLQVGTTSASITIRKQKRITDMKHKYLSLVFVLSALVWPMSSSGQEQTSNTDTQAPVLTLDEAVNIALENNRLVKNSVLEAQKYDFQVSTARSRRKPQFQFSMLGG